MENQKDLLQSLRRLNIFFDRQERTKAETEKMQKKLLQRAHHILLLAGRKKERYLQKLEERLQAYEETLGRILEVNQTVEQTLCKVLLAIRQNEYLQAWYPSKENSVVEKDKEKVG
jgi:hypothetical protein